MAEMETFISSSLHGFTLVTQGVDISSSFRAANKKVNSALKVKFTLDDDKKAARKALSKLSALFVPDN